MTRNDRARAQVHRRNMIVDAGGPRLPVDTVLEQGRRVHAWQLMHDLRVDVLGDFVGYWQHAMDRRSDQARAQVNGR